MTAALLMHNPVARRLPNTPGGHETLGVKFEQPRSGHQRIGAHDFVFGSSDNFQQGECHAFRRLWNIGHWLPSLCLLKRRSDSDVPPIPIEDEPSTDPPRSGQTLSERVENVTSNGAVAEAMRSWRTFSQSFERSVFGAKDIFHKGISYAFRCFWVLWHLEPPTFHIATLFDRIVQFQRRECESDLHGFVANMGRT